MKTWRLIENRRDSFFKELCYLNLECFFWELVWWRPRIIHCQGSSHVTVTNHHLYCLLASWNWELQDSDMVYISANLLKSSWILYFSTCRLRCWKREYFEYGKFAVMLGCWIWNPNIKYFIPEPVIFFSAGIILKFAICAWDIVYLRGSSKGLQSGIPAWKIVSNREIWLLLLNTLHMIDSFLLLVAHKSTVKSW